jgi:hypothetical protein
MRLPLTGIGVLNKSLRRLTSFVQQRQFDYTSSLPHLANIPKVGSICFRDQPPAPVPAEN